MLERLAGRTPLGENDRRRTHRGFVTYMAVLLVVGGGAAIAAPAVLGHSKTTRRGRAGAHPSAALLAARRRNAVQYGQIAENARRRWLATPEARHQRWVSRTEFRQLTSAAAEHVLEHVFGQSLSTTAATSSDRLAGLGHVLRYIGQHEAILSSGHGVRKIALSSFPLVVSHGHAAQRRVDLRLHRVGGAFLPAHPVAPIVIGSQLGAGVTLGADGFRLTLKGKNAPGHLLNNATAFFGQVATDTDATESVTPGGIELSSLLRSPESPTRLVYALRLPARASLRATSEGTVDVIRGANVLDEILPPVALDAQRTAVPVSMQVDGSSLVLRVRHRSGRFAYPILVDPQVVASAELGRWAESGYISPFDAGLYSVGDPYSLAAAAGKYVFGGGVEGATWTWTASAAVPGALGPATWTFYNLALQGDSANVQSAGIYVGGCNGTAPHGLISTQPGQSVSYGAVSFSDNNSCPSQQPVLQNQLLGGAGTSHGASMAMGGFLGRLSLDRG